MGQRGRPWRPKFKVECPRCHWRGVRTEFTIAARFCPRCRKAWTKKVEVFMRGHRFGGNLPEMTLEDFHRLGMTPPSREE